MASRRRRSVRQKIFLWAFLAVNTCCGGLQPQPMPPQPRGAARRANEGYFDLKTPWVNRGLTRESRPTGLRGLLPAGGPIPLETKVENVMTRLGEIQDPLDKFLYLRHIQDSEETLYYAVLATHTTEVMPLVYTPTVGLACERWGEIFDGSQPRGIYLSVDSDVDAALANHPLDAEVEVVVVTDGERILGLGDLGANGMGIPIGKLALYTACAGVDPRKCLAVSLDVGTDNVALRESPMYIGLRRPRVRGEEYGALVEAFISTCKRRYGDNVLIQFEDFGTKNAFALLDRYKNRACCFNDDIQGTAAVVLAGIMAALRLAGGSLADQTLLFQGAGEAGVGVANLVARAIAAETGCDEKTARSKIWLQDSKGLVTEEGDLAPHKLPYAHAAPQCKTLLESVEALKPSIIVGVSAQSGAFTTEVLRAMARLNERPVVFALSNPTSKAECTAVEAYTASEGRAIFASGSPFQPVTIAEQTLHPGQGNNAYIFPGVGLGALVAGSTTITDDDMLLAAQTLASLVTREQLALGCCYPPLGEIRSVSKAIACAVADRAFQTGVATKKRQPDLVAQVEDAMWQPNYDQPPPC